MKKNALQPVPGRWLMSRRQVLRGAAGAAIALPLLEAMSTVARAATPCLKRFVAWNYPGGTVYENWRPTGTETSFTLPKILEPMAPFQKDIIVIEGLEPTVAGDANAHGHPHYRGLAAFLTGSILGPGTYAVSCGGGGEATGWAQGPSLDQVIAAKIGLDTKFRTLEFGVRYDGPKGANPDKVMVYADANKPMMPIVDPLEMWNRLFPGGMVPGGPSNAKYTARVSSILDAVGEEYSSMAQRLGTDDRSKLQAHLASIRQVEISLTSGAGNQGSPLCVVPGTPVQTQYSSANIPTMGRQMMDMAVLALACDLTRVLTFQWLEPLAFNTFPFLNLGDKHHDYQHDKGYQPIPLTTIYNWYMQQFAYFVDRLSAIKECNGSLLDSSVIYHGTELQHPPDHGQTKMPFMLVGNLGGTFRTGRFLSLPSKRSNIDLLVALQNAFGIGSSTFGFPGYTAGPLPGLS